MPTFVVRSDKRGVIWRGRGDSVRDIVDRLPLSRWMQSYNEQLTFALESLEDAPKTELTLPDPKIDENGWIDLRRDSTPVCYSGVFKRLYGETSTYYLEFDKLLAALKAEQMPVVIHNITHDPGLSYTELEIAAIREVSPIIDIIYYPQSPEELGWVDYGYSKIRLCRYGKLYLEARPGYCDRGRFTLFTQTYGPVNNLFNILSNAYYFKEENAIAEVDRWLQLAQCLSEEQLENIKTLNSELLVSVIAQECEARIETLTLNHTKDPIYRFNVSVHEDKEDFVVDGADRFPRAYLNLSVAQEEMAAWMLERGQKNIHDATSFFDGLLPPS